jgi:hypothetical protein
MTAAQGADGNGVFTELFGYRVAARVLDRFVHFIGAL